MRSNGSSPIKEDEPVELLLDRFTPALLFRRPLVRFRTPLLPHVKDAIFYQAHVAGRRLQKCQFVDERAFERRLAHVHRSALVPRARHRKLLSQADVGK